MVSEWTCNQGPLPWPLNSALHSLWPFINETCNVSSVCLAFSKIVICTFGAAGRKNRNRGPAKIKLRVAVVKPKSSYTRVEVSVAAHFQILESRNLTDILKITAPSVNGKK